MYAAVLTPRSVVATLAPSRLIASNSTVRVMPTVSMSLLDVTM